MSGIRASILDIGRDCEIVSRDAAPKKIILSRHSVLIERTQRSAKAFMFGAQVV